LRFARSVAAMLLSAGYVLVLTNGLTFAQGSGTASSDKKPAAKTSSSQSSAAASKTTKSSAVSHKSSGKGKKTKKSASSRRRGQQKIDSQRTQEIQEALVREHYLTGQPSGKWDDATQKSLQKYQADHGWQSKTVPDSRALIKLGLGPNHDHLLNPESAMTTSPDGARDTSTAVGSPVSPGPSNQPNQPQ